MIQTFTGDWLSTKKCSFLCKSFLSSFKPSKCMFSVCLCLCCLPFCLCVSLSLSVAIYNILSITSTVSLPICHSLTAYSLCQCLPTYVLCLWTNISYVGVSLSSIYFLISVSYVYLFLNFRRCLTIIKFTNLFRPVYVQPLAAVGNLLALSL